MKLISGFKTLHKLLQD